MDWLIERVRWHLDPEQTTAKIYLVEDEGQITGHAIARIESADGKPFGYFSTVYVAPASRNNGVANALVLHVEKLAA